MDMSGEYRIPASRETVWAALNDLEVLQAAIPGCQSLERVSESEMLARVLAKVGPVQATFSGRLLLSNLNPPHSYTISGEGKGGPAGFAKGGADVRLIEVEGDTLLAYEVHAQVGGKLAQLGSRLIDSTAKKMADEFFANFVQRVTGVSMEPATAEFVDRLDHSMAGVQLGDEPSEPVVEDKAEEAANVAREVEEEIEVAAGRGFLGGPVVWGLLVIVVVVLLIYFLNGTPSPNPPQ